MIEGRVLCVKSDLVVALLIKQALKNFEVTIVQSIKEAELLLTERSFDLILASSHLPDGSGLDFCRSMREKSDRTPVLIIAGGMALKEADVEKAGAQGLIHKGFRFVQELESKVLAISDSSNQ